MRSAICRFCVGFALLYHQREIFYDCERSLCFGACKGDSCGHHRATAHCGQRARGARMAQMLPQNGPNGAQAQNVPSGNLAERCKTRYLRASETQNGPNSYKEEQRCTQKFEGSNITLTKCYISRLSLISLWLADYTDSDQFLMIEMHLKIPIALIS